MRLQKRKSSLDDWLDRGTTPEKFWKLLFYFFSRFILVFCILHYLGAAYPDSRWGFPGPTSVEFWACCVLFGVIFATVFYVIRGKRKGSWKEQKQIPLHPSQQASTPANKFAGDPGAGREPRSGNDRKKSNDSSKSSPAEERHEGRHGGVGRAIFASVVEEKHEGRHGGVGRATFEPEPELEEQRGEDEGDRRQ